MTADTAQMQEGAALAGHAFFFIPWRGGRVADCSRLRRGGPSKGSWVRIPSSPLHPSSLGLRRRGSFFRGYALLGRALVPSSGPYVRIVSLRSRTVLYYPVLSRTMLSWSSCGTQRGQEIYPRDTPLRCRLCGVPSATRGVGRYKRGQAGAATPAPRDLAPNRSDRRRFAGRP